MKLLILSDSHGEQEFMQLAVRRERPDAVIHLGDHCADADRLAEEFCGLPVLSVRGNCDLWGPPRAETTWKPSCRTSVKLCISGKSSAASWRA